MRPRHDRGQTTPTTIAVLLACVVVLGSIPNRSMHLLAALTRAALLSPILVLRQTGKSRAGSSGCEGSQGNNTLASAALLLPASASSCPSSSTCKSQQAAPQATEGGRKRWMITRPFRTTAATEAGSRGTAPSRSTRADHSLAASRRRQRASSASAPSPSGRGGSSSLVSSSFPVLLLLLLALLLRLTPTAGAAAAAGKAARQMDTSRSALQPLSSSSKGT